MGHIIAPTQFTAINNGETLRVGYEIGPACVSSRGRSRANGTIAYDEILRQAIPGLVNGIRYR